MIVIFGDKREVKKLFWGQGSFLCTCRLQKQPRPRRIARKEADRMMARARSAECGVRNEELEAYRNTDMTPDEILLASERLAAFEEIGMEPADLMDLARRDTAKEAVIWGEDKAMYCPACRHFHAVTAEYAQKHQFCEKCGQRIIPPASVPEGVL